MKNITHSPEWLALQTHQAELQDFNLQDAFRLNPARFEQLSLTSHDVLFDFSKNKIIPETVKLLCDLATSCCLRNRIEEQFNGDPINVTEGRPVLHTALRSQVTEIKVNKHNIMPDIHSAQTKLGDFSEAIRNGNHLGFSGKPITTLVNIGIGGSHLGPMTAIHALRDVTAKHLNCHFISNVDPSHLDAVFDCIDPETTLFIISSKSFTTIETLTNANTVKAWFIAKTGMHDLTQHFVAVTAAPQKAEQFGIAADCIFPLWDWVGGRYSIWSAISLPLIILIGMDHFKAFLAGANAMDEHIRHTDFAQNIPVMMALLGIWYINFWGANNQAILPYSHLLHNLPLYLQQADMESNGKSHTLDNGPVTYSTGPIIWGDQGCNAQHAFFQSLHQGTQLTPIDFILVGKNQHEWPGHQDLLVGSGLSQAQALMQGNSYDVILQELISKGMPVDQAHKLALHKMIPGNKPSNVLFLPEVTPFNLGWLLAAYEHKIFVQGVIWDLNSFDQWGVELGKALLPNIIKHLNEQGDDNSFDASTNGLIAFYQKIRKHP